MRGELSEELKNSCLEFANSLEAGGAKWKDETSYSRGDKERIPTVFVTKIGDCRISITCGHIYHPGEWIMNCYKLGIKEQRLEAVTTAKAAATIAILYCKNKVRKMYIYFFDN